MSVKQHASIIASALAIALSAVLSAPAHAQEPVAILKVDTGTVMVSEGAEFVAGATGTPLLPGQRLMVTEDAAAQVVYAEDCVVDYRVPGVYVVDSKCEKVAAVPPSSGSNAGMIAGVVGGVALIAAAAGGGGGSDSPPPPPVVPPPVVPPPPTSP